MQETELNPTELEILTSLNSSAALSQRELARRTGYSLGLINAVIKKLVHTGYIKTNHLNRRSVNYLLTARGFGRAAMKSYLYVVDTLRTYKTIQLKLTELIDKFAASGVTDFHLLGEGELAELVLLAFDGRKDVNLKRSIPDRCGKTLLILNAESRPYKKARTRVVNLFAELDLPHPNQANLGQPK